MEIHVGFIGHKNVFFECTTIDKNIANGPYLSHDRKSEGVTTGSPRESRQEVRGSMTGSPREAPLAPPGYKVYHYTTFNEHYSSAAQSSNILLL